MYEYEETTHNYFASLGYRLILLIAYLGVSLSSVMLECKRGVISDFSRRGGGEMVWQAKRA